MTYSRVVTLLIDLDGDPIEFSPLNDYAQTQDEGGITFHIRSSREVKLITVPWTSVAYTEETVRE